MCLVSDRRQCRDGVRATQACMRTLLTNSVNEYASFLKTCTQTQVTVQDCSTVTNDSKFRRPPLFAVDLAVEDDAFTYSSKLESFINVPLERFDDTLDGALVRVIPDRDEFQRLCERPAPGAVEAVEWCDDMESMCVSPRFEVPSLR